jgi:hypothetical protein
MGTVVNNSVLAWEPRAWTGHKSQSRMTNMQIALAQSGPEVQLGRSNIKKATRSAAIEIKQFC